MMLIFLPFLCFVFFYLILFRQVKANIIKRELFALSAVFWGLSVTISIEALSFFNHITTLTIALFWVIILSILLFVFFSRQREPKTQWIFHWKNLSLTEKILLLNLAVQLSLIALIAFFAPPNTYDSLTYHMGRVAHWIQNQSVEHYPTHIIRQLLYPPWAEYAIMHIQLLSATDRFANFIQCFAMIGCMINVSMITFLLGGQRKSQIIAAAIVGAIPMGILQGSSTQNDYVVAFWISCFLIFGWLLQREITKKRVFAFGCSLGLALLTKPTAYIYALPFLIYFSVIGIHKHRSKFVSVILLTLLIALTFNVRLYQRNYQLDGHILKVTGLNSAQMKEITPATAVSNIICNIAIELATPFPKVNRFIERSTLGIHDLLNLDLNDHRTKHGRARFRIPDDQFNEDVSGNALSFLLILLCILIFSFRKKIEHKKQLGIYLTIIIFEFLFLSITSQWHIFLTRYYLTLFILLSPFCAITLVHLSNKLIRNGLLIALILPSYAWIAFNHTRPLIGEHNVFTSRMIQYFPHRINDYYDYQAIVDAINFTQCSDIGFVTNEGKVEYPLWVLLKEKAKGKPFRLEHILVENVSGINTDYPLGTFEPCLIIETPATAKSLIEYGQTRFIKTNKYTYLDLYRKDVDGNLLKATTVQNLTEIFSPLALDHSNPNKDNQFYLNYLKQLKSRLQKVEVLNNDELQKIHPDLQNLIQDFYVKGITLQMQGLMESNKEAFIVGQKLIDQWNQWLINNAAQIKNSLLNYQMN